MFGYKTVTFNFTYPYVDDFLGVNSEGISHGSGDCISQHLGMVWLLGENGVVKVRL